MSDKTLIVCVGLPRSGKSAWARGTGYPVVSADAVRRVMQGRDYLTSNEPMVWYFSRLMVAALFTAGHHTVVLDACNGTRRQRQDWQDPRWECAYRVFDADAEMCMARAEATDAYHILPVIERLAARWEPFCDHEGLLLLGFHGE